jgi:hypothetical protein
MFSAAIRERDPLVFVLVRLFGSVFLVPLVGELLSPLIWSACQVAPLAWEPTYI